jgi:hypothetical protein
MFIILLMKDKQYHYTSLELKKKMLKNKLLGSLNGKTQTLLVYKKTYIYILFIIYLNLYV